MSCLQNEMILENLFEEILSELYIIHKDDVISIPFFIRTKAHDVVIMLTFLIIISLTKLTGGI